MALPIEFLDRMKELLGEEYDEFVRSYEESYYAGIRYNSNKINEKEFEDLVPCKVSKIPWSDNGFYYELNDQPAKHPFYHAGLYYIQEPSAMIPAGIMPIEEGDRVLDMCAAPGGKSTELAAKLKGTGFMVSNDISNSRAKALLKNMELFGITNSMVISENPQNLVPYFREYFDKILIDAPCSGEGMFRKDAGMVKNWEEYGVEYYSKIQKEIILYGADMLKPGGYMVYSTCTFAPEEDEATIEYLLKNRPGFSVEEINLDFEGISYGRPDWIESTDEQLKKCVRIWPHKVNGEGHFVTLLRKNENTSKEIGSSRNCYSYQSVKLPKEVEQFLEHVHLPFEKERMDLREERLYYLPEALPRVKGLRMLRLGSYLGDVKKNRFEPSQALASSLKQEEYDNLITIFSDSIDAVKYLKCETIDTSVNYKECTTLKEYKEFLSVDRNSGDGNKDYQGVILTRKKYPWYLVTVDGYSLGWAKLSGNSMKNKYFSGWRWM